MWNRAFLSGWLQQFATPSTFNLASLCKTAFFFLHCHFPPFPFLPYTHGRFFFFILYFLSCVCDNATGKNARKWPSLFWRNVKSLGAATKSPGFCFFSFYYIHSEVSRGSWKVLREYLWIFLSRARICFSTLIHEVICIVQLWGEDCSRVEISPGIISLVCSILFPSICVCFFSLVSRFRWRVRKSTGFLGDSPFLLRGAPAVSV